MTAHGVTALVEKANVLLERIAAALLLAGVATVVANVLARYTARLSLTWSAELARYLIVWSALLAAAVLVNSRGHLVVDLPWLRGTAKMRRRLETAVEAGCLCFFAIVLFSGVILVWRTAGQVASSMPLLPMSAVYSIVPVSALQMAAGSIARLIRMTHDERPGE